MSRILSFRSRDRRQSDPFRATPITHTGPQPRFADPHGIATDETLADLRALAETIDWSGRPVAVVVPSPQTAPAYGADAPFGAGRLTPLEASVEADLDDCEAFRDTVHAICVRSEPHHGCDTTWPSEFGTWQERFGAMYRHRTKPMELPDYTFAGELRALHAEMASAAADDLGPEFDQVEQRYEAGFFQARRVFHREDTAGFPAVVA